MPSVTWKHILLSFVVFTICDLLWLGVIMRSFYDSSLGVMARRSNGQLAPDILSAAVVYLLLVGGLLIFVLPAALQAESLLKAAALAGCFGLVVYGVYEGTNYSILAQWPAAMVVLDTLWGVVLYAITTTVVVLVSRHLGW